jgi:hypothetical protein
MFRPNGSEETGTHEYPAHIWHWNGPDLLWNALPVLGGDNEAVFKGLLGMSDADYDALVADGHISRDYLTPDGTTM